MRGIPTQAARVMRRNPELQTPFLVMVSPLVRFGFSLNCHTIVTIQNKRLRKIEENGKTFFCFSEIFFKSPPNIRLSHFETTPADASAIQAVTPSDIFSWPGPDVHLM
jgi:hypothetical protein